MSENQQQASHTSDILIETKEIKTPECSTEPNIVQPASAVENPTSAVENPACTKTNTAQSSIHIHEKTMPYVAVTTIYTTPNIYSVVTEVSETFQMILELLKDHPIVFGVRRPFRSEIRNVGIVKHTEALELVSLCGPSRVMLVSSPELTKSTYMGLSVHGTTEVDCDVIIRVFKAWYPKPLNKHSTELFIQVVSDVFAKYGVSDAFAKVM
jgi:hypothetical protein